MLSFESLKGGPNNALEESRKGFTNIQYYFTLNNTLSYHRLGVND